MAQPINPFDRKPKPDPAKQKELLARATGRPLLQTPPAAKPVPGITGNPPLPTGKVVGQVAPSSLTDVERDTLLAAGWTPDMPLPTSQEGIKQLQAAVAELAAVEVPFPVAPNTPPLKVTTVPLDTLPAADQTRLTGALTGKLQDIAAQEAEARKAALRRNELSAKEMSVKGIGKATGAADASVEAFRRRMAEQANVPVDDAPEVVAVNPAAVGAMHLQDHFSTRAEAQAPPPAAPPPAPEPHAHNETGAGGVMLTHCPHCQWDLAMSDIAEPPYQDKVGFLHAMIGDKPFAKEYPLFNGLVHVVFRTLTTKEIDKIYLQAHNDRLEGKASNDIDYYERLNRYRLVLQLQKFHSDGPDGFVKDLPDGYSQSANSHSVNQWISAEKEAEFSPNQTALLDIEAWIIDEVLKTEAVFRVVNNACNRFNRLVSRMEAMADNSDFWKPTGEQS